jgi:hypothetical protein
VDVIRILCRKCREECEFVGSLAAGIRVVDHQHDAAGPADQQFLSVEDEFADLWMLEGEDRAGADRFAEPGDQVGGGHLPVGEQRLLGWEPRPSEQAIIAAGETLSQRYEPGGTVRAQKASGPPPGS